jgi:hypothetical protein
MVSKLSRRFASSSCDSFSMTVTVTVLFYADFLSWFFKKGSSSFKVAMADRRRLLTCSTV